MKKFFVCFILAVSILFTSFVGTNTVCAAEQVDYNSYATYTWFEKFLTANPSRTTGTVGEAQAAQWLKMQMSQMGYTVQEQTFEAVVTDVVGTTSDVATSKNVIAEKMSPNQNAKTVIIGAHYDNASKLYNASGLETGGNGAMDNGSGVAVALTVAQRLASQRSVLPYNVRFVFFGAEELGMVGSDYYVSKLSQQERDNILLMINVDVVANGDNLYVWGEDISTPQANYFVDNSDGKINHTPADKLSMGVSVGYRSYYNICHMSDHMSFLTAKIPVAFFFSGNFNSGTFAFAENNGVSDISHTKNDTLTYLKDKFGIKFVNNMEAVAESIYSGVVTNASEFEDAVKDARNSIISDFWLDLNYAYLILFGLIVVCGIFAYSYYKKLQKRAILGTPEIKTTTVFEKPDEDDVFTFRS